VASGRGPRAGAAAPRQTARRAVPRLRPSFARRRSRWDRLGRTGATPPDACHAGAGTLCGFRSPSLARLGCRTPDEIRGKPGGSRRSSVRSGHSRHSRHRPSIRRILATGDTDPRAASRIESAESHLVGFAWPRTRMEFGRGGAGHLAVDRARAGAPNRAEAERTVGAVRPLRRAAIEEIGEGNREPRAVRQVVASRNRFVRRRAGAGRYDPPRDDRESRIGRGDPRAGRAAPAGLAGGPVARRCEASRGCAGASRVGRGPMGRSVFATGCVDRGAVADDPGDPASGTVGHETRTVGRGVLARHRGRFLHLDQSSRVGAHGGERFGEFRKHGSRGARQRATRVPRRPRRPHAARRSRGPTPMPTWPSPW